MHSYTCRIIINFYPLILIRYTTHMATTVCIITYVVVSLTRAGSCAGFSVTMLYMQSNEPIIPCWRVS